VVIVDGADEVVIGRLGTQRPDLALIDALARVQLEARRLGCEIRVRRPCQELCELLTLVGMTDLFVVPPIDGHDP
jgi:hypothetical protein